MAFLRISPPASRSLLHESRRFKTTVILVATCLPEEFYRKCPSTNNFEAYRADYLFFCWKTSKKGSCHHPTAPPPHTAYFTSQTDLSPSATALSASITHRQPQNVSDIVVSVSTECSSCHTPHSPQLQGPDLPPLASGSLGSSSYTQASAECECFKFPEFLLLWCAACFHPVPAGFYSMYREGVLAKRTLK